MLHVPGESVTIREAGSWSNPIHLLFTTVSEIICSFAQYIQDQYWEAMAVNGSAPFLLLLG